MIFVLPLKPVLRHLKGDIKYCRDSCGVHYSKIHSVVVPKLTKGNGTVTHMCLSGLLSAISPGGVRCRFYRALYRHRVTYL